MAIKTLAQVSASAFNDPYPGPSNISTFAAESSVWYFGKRNNDSDFLELVKRRCEYMDSLKALRSDWISGTSTSPNIIVLNQAKDLLQDFSGWLQGKNSLPKPELVMGPIPVGGFSVEFKIIGKVIIYLSLFNDKTSTIEIEDLTNGTFSELETRDNSLEYLLKRAYEYFSMELIPS